MKIRSDNRIPTRCLFDFKLEFVLYLPKRSCEYILVTLFLSSFLGWNMVMLFAAVIWVLDGIPFVVATGRIRCMNVLRWCEQRTDAYTFSIFRCCTTSPICYYACQSFIDRCRTIHVCRLSVRLSESSIVTKTPRAGQSLWVRSPFALSFFSLSFPSFFYFYPFLLYYWFVRQSSKIHARISLSPCPVQLRIAARIDWLIWWRDTWTHTLFTSLCHSIIRYAFTWFNSISFRIVSALDAIFFFLSIGWEIERERERKKTTSIIYQPKCR